MKDFVQQVIFEGQGVSVSYLDVALWIVIFFVTLSTNILISRFIQKSSIFGNFTLAKKRIVFNSVRSVTWLIALALALALAGFNTNNFLNFYIIGSAEKAGEFVLQPKHFIWALVIILLTRIILIGVERIFSSGKQFREDNQSKSKAVYKFASYLVWIFAFMAILRSTGIDLTLIWGAGAALLVGVGFGLQHIITDLISGIFLLFEGNLREGDIVELNNGIIGQVEKVGIRTSKIQTRNDYIMIIPNSQFIIKEVINWSHNEPKTRFHIDVGVAYGSDVRKVEQVLLQCMTEHASISETPKPFVRFSNFGNSSLDFQLFFWSTNTFRIENLKSDLRFRIDELFRQNEIVIPFPQHDIHIKSGGGH